MDNVKQNIIQTGLLPEGMYKLCVDVVDYNTNAVLSNVGQGCAAFDISQAQPPVITFPADGQTIPLDQRAIDFSWTPPIGNLGGAVAGWTTGEILQRSMDSYAKASGEAGRALGLTRGYELNFVCFALVYVVAVFLWLRIDATQPVVAESELTS